MSRYVSVRNHWPDAELVIRRNVEQRVERVALSVERQIVGNITTAGLVDTGNYRRSWTTSAAGTSAEVGSPVEYGVYLEYGHYTRKSKELGGIPRSFVLGRPHVVPAARTIGARVADYFRNLDR